eukprot:1220564-Pyramimonas_sp.AAC.1
MTAQCVDAVVRVCLGDRPPRLSGPCRLRGGTEETLREVLAAQRRYWEVLNDAHFLAEWEEFFRTAAHTPTTQNRKEAERISGQSLMD